MFRITLLNVGSDMVNKDFVSHVDTLAEVEVVAKNAVEKCLYAGMADFIEQPEGEYLVYCDTHCAGSVTITKLN